MKDLFYLFFLAIARNKVRFVPMHLTQVQHLKTFPSSDDDLQPNNETSLESNNRIFWQVEWLLSRNEEATLAACSSDRIIRMFPSSNSLPVLLTNAHTKTIRCITFSSDAKLLAAGSFDSTISIWKRSGDSSSFTWKCISTLQGHDSEVKDVSFSFDDSFLASCGRDKSIWVWSVQYEGEDEDFDIQSHSLLTDHSQDVKCVKWHPSMMLFASASYDNTIKIFAADEDDEFNCVATLLGHTETAWRVEFIPKHNLLVSASSDSTIKFWKMPQDISQSILFIFIYFCNRLELFAQCSCWKWNDFRSIFVYFGYFP